MRSTVYMNHYPHFRSSTDREAVTVDLSASVAELSYPRSVMGHAVDLTFRTLGFDMSQPPAPSNMLVFGSQKSIEQNQKNLRINIGAIAQRANDAGEQRGFSREPYLADTMDSIAQSVVPKAVQTNDFIQSVGMILNCFGQDCNDDGCGVEYGKRVGWYSTMYDENAAFRDLPQRTQAKLLDAPILQFDLPKEEVAQDLRTLRNLAFYWAIDHASMLKKRGLTANLRQEYEQDCELNVEAIKRVNAYVLEQTGKPRKKLCLPMDVTRNLVATARMDMANERQLQEWREKAALRYAKAALIPKMLQTNIL